MGSEQLLNVSPLGDDVESVLIDFAQGEGKIYVQGLNTPVDGLSGYAIGCIFIHPSADTGFRVFFNAGTLTSTTWRRVESGGP